MTRETTGSWAAHELQYVQLGDARLNRRLINLVGALADQPTSPPEADTGSVRRLGRHQRGLSLLVL